MHVTLPDHPTRTLPARASERGMSLIEILVVLAIIGLVVGGITYAVIPQFDKAKIDSTYNDVRTTSGLCETYYMQRGKCPKTMQDLKVAGILSHVKKDPWENDFKITCADPKTRCRVSSAGPDGNHGTPDDIKSWEKPKDDLAEGEGDED